MNFLITKSNNLLHGASSLNAYAFGTRTIVAAFHSLMIPISKPRTLFMLRDVHEPNCEASEYSTSDLHCRASAALDL
jgi:hypothetical protein